MGYQRQLLIEQSTSVFERISRNVKEEKNSVPVTAAGLSHCRASDYFMFSPLVHSIRTLLVLLSFISWQEHIRRAGGKKKNHWKKKTTWFDDVSNVARIYGKNISRFCPRNNVRYKNLSGVKQLGFFHEKTVKKCDHKK